MRTTTYEVIDLNDGTSHGTFGTLEEAQGCVDFDRLRRYQIIRNGWVVVSESIWTEG